MGVLTLLHTNTVHLQESTYEMLNEDAVYCEAVFRSQRTFQFMSVYHLGEYGYLLDIDEAAFIDASKTQEIPNDLKSLIRLTLTHGCHMIRLDDDGEPCGSLPKYID